MTRLLVSLTQEALDAIDALMEGADGYRPGNNGDRAGAIGELLVDAADLAARYDRQREELQRLRESERSLHLALTRERSAHREADASARRLMNSLKAQRQDHARTRGQLRNARATAARLREARERIRARVPRTVE